MKTTIDIQRRKARQECSECFFPRVAGRAMTEFRCIECGLDSVHTDTAVPMICGPCAIKNDLCCRCGETMD